MAPEALVRSGLAPAGSLSAAPLLGCRALCSPQHHPQYTNTVDQLLLFRPSLVIELDHTLVLSVPPVASFLYVLKMSFSLSLDSCARYRHHLSVVKASVSSGHALK